MSLKSIMESVTESVETPVFDNTKGLENGKKCYSPFGIQKEVQKPFNRNDLFVEWLNEQNLLPETPIAERITVLKEQERQENPFGKGYEYGQRFLKEMREAGPREIPEIINNSDSDKLCEMIL